MENDEFYDNIKIKFADHIISIMDKVNRYPIKDMIAATSIKEIQPNITIEQQEKFDSEYRVKVSSFLITEDLIIRLQNDYPDNTVYYKLSELGKQVKKRGGYNNLLIFEERIDKVPFQTLRWARVAGLTGLAVLILGLWSETKGCNYSHNQRQTTIKINPKDSAKLDISK